MPYGDKTGPSGQGPMTGRGRGLCAGPAVPGNMNQAPGFGFGRCGRGGGRRGRQRQFNATGLPGWQRAVASADGGSPTPSAPLAPGQEIAALNDLANTLHAVLNQMRKTLDELAIKARE